MCRAFVGLGGTTQGTMKRTSTHTIHNNGNKNSKTRDDSIVNQYSTQLLELKSLSTTFQKLFEMLVCRDNLDMVTEEYALHTWKTMLTNAFDSHFHDDNEEKDVNCTTEEETISSFVRITIEKLMQYLNNKCSTTLSTDLYKKERNIALHRYVNERVIPTVLDFIAELKSGKPYDLIIPKDVKLLNVTVDMSLTCVGGIRDLFVTQNGNGLLCFSSSTINNDTDENDSVAFRVPLFYEIKDYNKGCNTVIKDGDVKHENVPLDILYNMADSSSVALLNDNELLIFYDVDIYLYNRTHLSISKLQINNSNLCPKFNTGDIVARDDDNFILLAETGSNQCDMWNFNYSSLTWSIIDKNIMHPVPDAITIHKGELYILIPSAQEEKASIFQKYNFQEAKWSKVFVNGFSPLMDRVRIQSLGEILVAFGDFEGSTLLFVYFPQTGQWRAVDLDPTDDSEEDLFDTLIAKNMKDNRLIVYYEYYSSQNNIGHLQYIDLSNLQ